ncbi:MAG: 15-cis-phytoene synthase, partial [bacterium]
LRCRCGARSAHTSSTRACARRSRFHSLFIGGDPFRVPAIYGALRFAAASHAARRPRLPALHPRHHPSGGGRADVLLVRARARAIGARYAIARRLLPRDLRDDVYLLYLVCRTLDDLVDTRNPSAPSQIAAAEAWCAGEAASSRESRLLAGLARRHALPRRALADFCQGMRDDLGAVAIETEAELDRYCHRVAGTVGVVMAALLGATDPAAPRGRARPGDAAHEHPARHRRGPRQRAGLPRVRDARAAGGGALPPPARREELLRDQIARADALYDLYRVGGTAHPGGGLPLVALGGAVVADLIGPA